jgi:hypothetical protein
MAGRTRGRPRPYPPGSLIPCDDPDIPHVTAAERLIRWLPEPEPVRDARGRAVQLSHELREQTRQAVYLGLKPTTRGTYGTGIMWYAEFMLENGVPKDGWLPMTFGLAQVWVTTKVGVLGRSAMANAIAAVHTWEKIKGVVSPFSAADIKNLLRTVDTHAPTRKAPRPPLRIRDLEAISGRMDLTSYFDYAFFACLVIIFFCTARVG